MSNREHLEILHHGVTTWNEWRLSNPTIEPDLIGAALSGVNLCEINFKRVDLSGANLTDANLEGANLTGADLRGADLSGARLIRSNIYNVNFRYATLAKSTLAESSLDGSDFYRADVAGANLRGCHLSQVNFSSAELSGADFSAARCWDTIFADTDLSQVTGLEAIQHLAPSTVGVDTLFRSDGKIPEAFLRGVGFPQDFITFVPSLVGRAIEFYSCFISYSQQDEEFSQLLHSRMRRENLRVWFAPEDMKAGRKLHEEIFQAIQIHDKLLLVLSENSMKSEWVMTEIRRARKVEREESRRKLFPIRLVGFQAIESWECFDSDSGKDLAIELREYYIPDFSNWKDHDAFEAGFARLLRDLKATERRF
jgi:TIR domain-containing protein/pentapeptide repeat protein